LVLADKLGAQTAPGRLTPWRAGSCLRAKSAGRPFRHRRQGGLGRSVLPKLFQASSGRGTVKSENCNPTTPEPGTRRRLVLLQTLTTQDFDELASALPRWDLRCRQLGRGPFRGQLQVLQLGRIQVFRIAANRMLHFAGWPPPGCFGSAPVLAANETA